MGLFNFLKGVTTSPNSDWARSYALVRVSEGNNSDNRNDSGGRTSRGVTQATYNADRRRRGLHTQDVYLATETEIETIYHDTFWAPYCEKLPPGLDYLVFDFGVNAGPHQAVLTLQRAVNVDADGVLGPVTLEAVDNKPVGGTIYNFTSHRILFYKNLGEPEFIQGWINRANAAEVAALKMVGPLH